MVVHAVVHRHDGVCVCVRVYAYVSVGGDVDANPNANAPVYDRVNADLTAYAGRDRPRQRRGREVVARDCRFFARVAASITTFTSPPGASARTSSSIVR